MNPMISQSDLNRLAAASGPDIAVLVPCYNEEVAIPAVVRDFRKALPDGVIYVYDNNSRDAPSRSRAQLARS